jgi:predicted Zn-dependent protease
VTRHPACGVMLALVVAAMILADLGMGVWLAPSARAQSASPYHWARKNSHFRLRVGNDVKGDWNQYLRAALSDWNQNDTITLVEVDGGTDPQFCEPVSGRVEVCDWWYGTQTGWLGLTRLYFNATGDHIDAATVQLNNSFLYAPNSRYNSDAARRHTLCHELGHTLGLDHPDTTSCMNNSQHAVFNYVTPLNEDFRQLRRIYEHTDASRTVARASEADLNLFGPTSWPEPDSEEDVMALPLDEETLVLTFVIWAEEEDLSETDITGTELGADSDGDHVADADELNLYQTDPTLADTDGDGMVDGDELFATETDPLLWDDVSAAVSGEPVAESRASAPALEQVPAAVASPMVPADAAFPTDTDLDADNYPDASESAIGLDPGNPDTDSDGVADGDEGTLYGTDPLSADTDDDGLTDGAELFGVGTNPLIWDTDSDGLKDGETTPP